MPIDRETCDGWFVSPVEKKKKEKNYIHVFERIHEEKNDIFWTKKYFIKLHHFSSYFLLTTTKYINRNPNGNRSGNMEWCRLLVPSVEKLEIEKHYIYVFMSEKGDKNKKVKKISEKMFPFWAPQKCGSSPPLCLRKL